jgi:FkbM family methyltransferase
LGWCNIIYAKFCGPENMVLIEPADTYWPNIKTIWEHNYPGVKPLACFEGFFSNETTAKRILQKHKWPKSANGYLWARTTASFRYIHTHGNEIPQIKIDDYVKKSGIIPTALTMDVEGAEFLVLQGAENILREAGPKVWVSIHPGLAEYNYHVTLQQIHDFMRFLGYKEQHLATDHEEHWYFTK